MHGDKCALAESVLKTLVFLKLKPYFPFPSKYPTDGQTKKQRYLVMGKRVNVGRGGVQLIPSFIHPWTRSKVLVSS